MARIGIVARFVTRNWWVALGNNCISRQPESPVGLGRMTSMSPRKSLKRFRLLFWSFNETAAAGHQFRQKGRAQRKTCAKSQQANLSFLDAFGTRFGPGFGKFRYFETRRPAVREARKKNVGGESPAGPIFFSHGPHIVTTGAVLVLASGSI